MAWHHPHFANSERSGSRTTSTKTRHDPRLIVTDTSAYKPASTRHNNIVQNFAGFMPTYSRLSAIYVKTYFAGNPANAGIYCYVPIIYQSRKVTSDNRSKLFQAVVFKRRHVSSAIRDTGPNRSLQIDVFFTTRAMICEIHSASSSCSSCGFGCRSSLSPPFHSRPCRC